MSNISYSVLTLPASYLEWYLVSEYLKLRRSVFVDKMGWELPTYHHQEFEDYDGGAIPHYVVAHQDDQVIAGARLLRCNTEFDTLNGPRSYMIRDASLGRIAISPTIWTDGEPPTDEATWEFTRLVSFTKDRHVTRNLVQVANDYISRMGGRRCLFLCPPAVFRLAKSYGFGPQPCGPRVVTPDETYQCFQCPIV